MNASDAVSHYGSISAAARELGIARQTLQGRLDAEKRKGKSVDNVLTFPEVPSRKEPIEKLLERRVEHFNRNKAHHEAAHFQKIHVDSKLPIAVALMGDPHIDDDGCDVPALLDDIAILARTEGLYAANIGDTTNNWVGRLARLFGNQETSQTSARQLAAWLLTGAGIKWLAVILGNHDEWNEGGEIIKLMCAAAKVEIPVHEWQAKLELVFPIGDPVRLNLAHNFKGASIYSSLHGIRREAIWCQDGTDIFAAGHIHFGEMGQIELPGGHNPWLFRARGYKHFDPHALVNGYHNGNRFRCPVVIIDPRLPKGQNVMGFAEVRQAAAVLELMRNNAKCEKPKSVAKSRKVVARDTSKKRVVKSGTKRHAGNRAKRSRGRR